MNSVSNSRPKTPATPGRTRGARSSQSSRTPSTPLYARPDFHTAAGRAIATEFRRAATQIEGRDLNYMGETDETRYALRIITMDLDHIDQQRERRRQNVNTDYAKNEAKEDKDDDYK